MIWPTEEKLHLIIERAPSGMLVLDREGTIVFANPEIERQFGYTITELLSKSVDMLVPERFRQNHVQSRVDFFAHPSVRNLGAGRDLYGLRKDGTEIPVEIGLTPLDSEEVLATIIDITKRKELAATPVV